ncbi:MAG: bifunctional tetrahydrofolate synthase/dihydrofolate synthase [Betaproteobacteria bacterium]|nr:bifunctional tetrahydrofolate synthase/dihydrofolate synthase [Betaproteobacteria bacterium]
MRPETRNQKQRTLEQWLEHLERLHPQVIAMGLERVLSVKQALALDPGYPILTVGGTNGKGSCCAMLEAALRHAGYRVGCYTSPHLLRYNERVRIGGREVSDEILCAAFARVESARGNTLLTYFEFSTLAAMLAFAEAGIEVAILEVGLGGRLDAVNAFDADCALVASIDLDHQGYLGDTRDAIGFEKAGIFRAGRPAICADADPPVTLSAHAGAIGAELLLIDRDFGHVADKTQWRYWGPGGKRHGLPYPALRGAYQLANAAACITALDCLRERLPVTAQDIRSGLLKAEPTGRFQVLPGQPQVILDVAHNPHAARALAANLANMPKSAQTIAVFAMLKDKDVAGVVDAVKNRITHWFVATTEGPRGAAAQQIAAGLQRAGITVPVTRFEDVAGAWRAACKTAAENDKIIVFGSFLTVAAVIRERQRANEGQVRH